MPSLFFKQKEKKTDFEHNENELCKSETVYINPRLIFSNPTAVRTSFDEGQMLCLADSIRNHGMLVPLSVRVAEGGKYELINGERRLRAAKLIGLNKVPCVVKNCCDSLSALYFLMENLSANQLNYFEIADCMQRLMKKYSYTKCMLAQQLSMSQSTIGNYLKLLDFLPSERDVLIKNNFSQRQARAILRLSPEKRDECIEYVASRRLNGFQTELYIDNLFSIEAAMRFHTFEEISDYNEIVDNVSIEQSESASKNKFILKDLKLFYNSIDNAVQLLKSAGIEIYSSRDETDSAIKLNIEIRKKSDSAVK